MADAKLIIHRRKMPHWVLEGSVYFVTYRLKAKHLNSSERKLILSLLIAGHSKHYNLSAAVVMPDHVHLILQPLPGDTLSKVMQGIKGVSARRLNQLRGESGTVWQAESWDRILRDEAEYEEKLNYMLNNPVKAELIDDGWNWDGWYFNPDFLPR